MSRKRGFLILFVLLLFTSILCSCGDVIVEPKWIIGVKGADAAVFSASTMSSCMKSPLQSKQSNRTVVSWKKHGRAFI
jgi:hypothetical protein